MRRQQFVLLRKVQVVVEPLPRLDFRHAETGGTVGEGCEVEEAPDQSGDDDAGCGPGGEQGLAGNALPDGPGTRGLGDLAAFLGEGGGVGWLDVEDELDQGTGDEGAGEMSWQIMVQEELAAHDEEGDVVSGPGQEEESGAVVQAGASTCQLY